MIVDQSYRSGLELFIDLLGHGAHPPGLKQERHQTWGASRGYVVATGAQPHVGGIAGIEQVDYLTSSIAMELRDLPASLVVIGGGYVGMEQAQLFALLGSRVTVAGRLAPHTEPELAEVRRRVFAEDGITVVEERAVAATATDVGVAVTPVSGIRVEGQRVLVATGRRPDTTAMTLLAAGVDTDDRGFVVIDEHQRTSNPRVFAAGDVAGTRSTSTSPPRPGMSPPRTHWTRPRNGPWTTPGCRR